MDGQDVVGNKFEWSKQWQRVVPMLAMDIADTVKYRGPHAPPGSSPDWVRSASRR
jgi:hypothetical protein